MVVIGDGGDSGGGDGGDGSGTESIGQARKETCSGKGAKTIALSTPRPSQSKQEWRLRTGSTTCVRLTKLRTPVSALVAIAVLRNPSRCVKRNIFQIIQHLHSLVIHNVWSAITQSLAFNNTVKLFQSGR
jgi:uncharacterized protein (DUF2252 family)